MRNSNVLRRARQRAKSLSSTADISHQQALDRVASEAGHANWGAMLSAQSGKGPTIPLTIASEESLQPAFSPDDLRFVFARRWEMESVRAGIRPFDHHLGAAMALSVCNGAMLRTGGPGTQIIAACATARSTEDPSGDPVKVLAWIGELAGEASRAAERRNVEAAAAKQLPTATVAREFVRAYRSVVGDDLVDRDILDAIANVTDADFDGMLSAFRVMASSGTRVELEDLVSVRWRLPVGIVAMLLARRSVGIALTDDERALLVGFVSSSGSMDDRDYREGLSVISLRTRGLKRAVDALVAVTSLHGRDDMAAWISEPGAVMPRADGSSVDAPLLSDEGLMRIRDCSSSVFASWLTDAVRKADRGIPPFRFNPLVDDGRPGFLDVNESDWRSAQEEISRVLVMACRSIDSPVAHDAVAALTALVALVTVGMRKGTIDEIGEIRGAVPTMGSVAVVASGVRTRGIGQIVLYARILGMGSSDIDAIMRLDDGRVLDIVETSLRPFSHPLLERAVS